MPYIEIGEDAVAQSFASVSVFPPAGQAGRLAYAIAEVALYYDNGSAWVSIDQVNSEVTAAAGFGTDNAVLRANGVDKVVQASTVIIDDSGNISGVGTINGTDVGDFVVSGSTPSFAGINLTNIVVSAASDAGNLTVTNGTIVQVLGPDAASVASFTLTFPEGVNGQPFFVTNGSATNAIVALTIVGQNTDTVVAPLTSLPVGGKAGYIYHTASTTWYRIS